MEVCASSPSSIISHPSMRVAFGVVLLCAILFVFSVQYEVLLPTLNRQEQQTAPRIQTTTTPNVVVVVGPKYVVLPPTTLPAQRTSPKVATSSPKRQKSSSSSSSSKKRSLVVDVLSSGSTSRWDYIEAQQRTWGSHPSIRSFEGVSEEHHALYNASCEGIKEQVAKCRLLGNVTRDGRKYYFAPEIKPQRLFTKKSEGWFCAQHRPVIGLHSIYGPRYRDGSNNKNNKNNNNNLPDWLLIVDDDTTFHMNVFELAVSTLNPETAHVLVGRPIFYGWPLGGFGVALSRAAVRRLFSPMYCKSSNKKSKNTNNQDLIFFSQQFCQTTLRNNSIFEQEEFKDGMSIMDLMLAIQLHRKPFCWHSDWYTGWFLTNHIMLGERLPMFPELPPPYNCRPNSTTCTITTLSCHSKNRTERLQQLMGTEF